MTFEEDTLTTAEIIQQVRSLGSPELILDETTPQTGNSWWYDFTLFGPCGDFQTSPGKLSRSAIREW